MGKASKDFGDLFEDIFERNCRLNGVAITRIPNGAKRVGPKPTDLVPVKTPWDWVITYRHQTALIDTKTVQKSTFGYSEVTEHQAKELWSHERSGAIAGYVIWFRSPISRVIFFPAVSLMQAISSKRGSFSYEHRYATYLGTEMFDIKRIFKGVHP